MLFQYTYPENHSFESLNQYLVQFVNSLNGLNENSRFIVNNYFHPDFVDILNNSPKLKDKFEQFFHSFKLLQENEKNRFITLLNNVQDFQHVFSDTAIDLNESKTDSINFLIGNDSFKQLADYLFTCVKYERWNIKGHYQLIYDALDHKVCPFCGIHNLHRSFREDYDHLAPKALYPLVSIHPRNLAPMCHDCNAKNKGAKDVFYAEDGNRRAFVYPYNRHLSVELDFSDSTIPQTDINNQAGQWEITFNPDNAETETWDEIFNIKNRYLVDFLLPHYETWITDFVLDCIESGILLNEIDIIREQLSLFGRSFNRKWYEQANIIKGPLFSFLANCNNDVFYNSIVTIYNRNTQAA